MFNTYPAFVASNNYVYIYERHGGLSNVHLVLRRFPPRVTVSDKQQPEHP